MDYSCGVLSLTLSDLTNAIRDYRRASPWRSLGSNKEFALRLDRGDYYLTFFCHDEDEILFDITYADDCSLEQIYEDITYYGRGTCWGGLRVSIEKRRVKVMRYKHSGYLDWLKPADLAILRNVLEGMVTYETVLRREGVHAEVVENMRFWVIDVRNGECVIRTM